MTRFIKYLTLVYFICFVGTSQGQSLQQVRDELYKINKIFDSTAYLGFDLNVQYKSDTAFGKFEFEEMTGSYILNRRNIYYKMGNMEFVQNDSFSYSLYHDDKTMIMTRDSLKSNGTLFPLKEFVDSIILWYSTVYSISVRSEEDLRVIEFNTIDTTAPYQRFAVYYDSVSYYPDKFVVDLIDEPDDTEQSESVEQVPQPVKKRITMNFKSYHFVNNLEIFADSNYVIYDAVRKEYRPTGKYKGYDFMASNIVSGDKDDAIEMYPPPTGN